MSQMQDLAVLDGGHGDQQPGAAQEQCTVWDHLGTCPTIVNEYICLQIPVLCLRFGNALG